MGRWLMKWFYRDTAEELTAVTTGSLSYPGWYDKARAVAVSVHWEPSPVATTPEEIQIEHFEKFQQAIDRRFLKG